MTIGHAPPSPCMNSCALRSCAWRLAPMHRAQQQLRRRALRGWGLGFSWSSFSACWRCAAVWWARTLLFFCFGLSHAFLRLDGPFLILVVCSPLIVSYLLILCHRQAAPDVLLAFLISQSPLFREYLWIPCLELRHMACGPCGDLGASSALFLFCFCAEHGLPPLTIAGLPIA